jgi:hypothetical protein
MMSASVPGLARNTQSQGARELSQLFDETVFGIVGKAARNMQGKILSFKKTPHMLTLVQRSGCPVFQG